MSWRTICLTKRCKLEYQLGYLIIRGDEKLRIHLSEISNVIIESTAISLTASLLNELNKHKVKVIFCDEQHNPWGEIMPYYGSYDASRSVREQINWTSEIKDKLWQEIIRDKINKQAQNLESFSHVKEAQLLRSYVPEVVEGDKTNREGHAAKVYFNTLFEDTFTRHSGGMVNAILDYGYSILLAAFNREITALGKLTQLGIWHCNTFNPFNLSSDLMEAFRPIVDYYVLKNDLHKSKTQELSVETKHALLSILDLDVLFNGQTWKLNDVIKLYTKSMIHRLDDHTFETIPLISYG